MRLLLWMVFFGVWITSCQSSQQGETQKPEDKQVDFKAPPKWASEAIWYQIFVERFRNGNPNNDPTLHSVKEQFQDTPNDWEITPWGSDWYKPDAYFSNLEKDNFGAYAQYRRYGGDLEGVMEKIPYLKQLGITAIYFNPLNDAPSLHKYDPRYWHHIDRFFGPNPKKDSTLMANENPIDASNWPWTTADSLFVELVKALHQNKIKVIMDYSFNHTGVKFWAFEDVKQNGQNSAFKDWYDVEHFDDPNTPENEFDYKGWIGIKNLPEIKKAIVGQDTLFPFQGNFYSETAKQHMFEVAKRWLDPNGDGNFDDGVDGYRLDVAAEVPIGFWKEFRKEVKTINPNAYLVGEVWWKKWPDDLMNPSLFLQGDVFDAVMNYRWYRAARRFFAKPKTAIDAENLKIQLDTLQNGFDTTFSYAMMNIAASHDVPRLATSFGNRNKYKYQSKPQDDENYYVGPPDEITLANIKLFLLHQFTYVGAPQIWYGDEVGMWGADDPDCRKPMLWEDISYQPETFRYDGKRGEGWSVKRNEDLFKYYQKVIQLRKRNKALSLGNLKWIKAEGDILVYERSIEAETILVIINNSGDSVSVKLPQLINAEPIFNGNYRENESVKLNPKTGEVFILQ